MKEIISNKELEQVTGGAEETVWAYVINGNDFAYTDETHREIFSVEEAVRTNDPGARIAVRRLSGGKDRSGGKGGMIQLFVSSFMEYFEKYGGNVNGRILRF